MFILKEPSGIQLIQPLKEIFAKENIPEVDPTAKTAEQKEGSAFPGEAGRYVKIMEAYQQSEAYKKPQHMTFARDIMTHPVQTLSQSASLSSVWSFFTDQNLRHAVLVDHKGELVGVISERDLLRAERPLREPAPLSLDAPVSQIMKSSITCCRLNTEIRHIALVMFEKRVGIMPVLDETNRLEGVITRSDILKSLIKFAPVKMWM